MIKPTATVLLMLSAIFSAELTNVGLDQGWVLDSDVTLNETKDTLAIVGTVGATRRAVLTVPVDPTTRTLYFVADVYLSSNTLVGDQVYKAPRFKLFNSVTDEPVEFYNMSDPLLGKWYTTGVKVDNFHKKGVSSLRIELLMQQCEGTMSLSNPRLTDTPPEVTYTFPYPVPADKSCKIKIVTSEKRVLPSNLFSVNSHFQWSSCSWGDDGIRKILK